MFTLAIVLTMELSFCQSIFAAECPESSITNFNEKAYEGSWKMLMYNRQSESEMTCETLNIDKNFDINKYVVFATDYYSYSINMYCDETSDPPREFAWILTRDPVELPTTLIDRFTRIAKEYGLGNVINVDTMIATNCEPQFHGFGPWP